MKMKNSILVAILIGVCLITSCRTLQTKDFKPSNRQFSSRLPALEPLIDIYSFENAYLGKSSSNQGVYSGAKQNYAYYYVDDAATIFLKDVKQNMIEDYSDYNGYLVCRIVKHKEKNKLFWGLTGGFTLCIPWVLGAPIYQYEDEVWIEVDIRSIKNELISTYRGHGKYTVSNGFYYGFKLRKEYSYMRKPKIESVKRALDEVKIKMSADCNSLSATLNNSMNVIQQERLLSTQQSIIEPTNFLDGNKKFDEKNYKSSIDLYNSVLEKHPYHTYALLNRARANSSAGDNISAIKDFTRVIELDPKNVDAYYYRGFAYGNLLELNAAVYNYNKVIEISPDMVQAYLMRAAAEEDLTQNTNAVKDYQKVLSLNPNFIYAKERLNIVQERISQNIAQQQQQLEQERINRLNTLSASLNVLSNTLNTVNNTTKTTSVTNTSTSNTSTQNSGTNAHLQKVTCTYCKGTGVSSYPSQGTCFGIESYHFCDYCKKTVPCSHGPHLNCIPCQGKGYTEKYVP